MFFNTTHTNFCSAEVVCLVFLRQFFCEQITEVISKPLTENSTVIEGDCQVSLRFLSQQLINVKSDRLQPWIEPVT